MKEAALILIATFAFAGVAFIADWPAPETHCPEAIEIIRYLDRPEPQPIYPAPKLLSVTDFEPPRSAPVEVEEAPETEPHRRYRRRHRRRH